MVSSVSPRPNTEGPEVIRVEGVSKSFVIRKDNSLKERVVTFGRRGRVHQESFSALKDVSFSIRAGSSLGLLGSNGSGKSTLLKVIGGIIDPSSGTVQRRGRLAALLELGAGFHPDLSGRENVYLNAAILGLSKEETAAEFDSILAFSEIGDFIDTQVKFYSSGMYVRLAFAVAVHTNPDVLLVDEVLAVGDEAFQRKCMDKIRQFQREGRTIVLVSHSAEQVMEVCDRGLVLNHGEVAFIGSAADATRVHREILEGRRRSNAEAEAEAAAGTPAPVPQIAGITVRDAAGEIVDGVQPGEQLTIELAVDLPQRLDEWHSSVSIDTPNGQQCSARAHVGMRRATVRLRRAS
jgi:ABC-2 type transport system ATP-binding protein